MDQAVRRRLFVSGVVQGVFYRDSLRSVANQRGVAGWARNLGDGRVEVVLEGAAPAVAQVVEWCRHGPRRAHVEGVEIVEEPVQGEFGFAVR